VAVILAGASWNPLLALPGRADLVGDERFEIQETRIRNPKEVEEIVKN